MNTSNNETLMICNIFETLWGLHALKDVSLTLHPGEVLALAGDNGAGKSTLIQTISGVHKPDTGTIKYCGKLMHLETPHQARMRDRGIDQDLAIADNLDVGGNVFSAGRRSSASADCRSSTAADETRGPRDLAGARYRYPVPGKSAAVSFGGTTSIGGHWTCHPLESALLIMDEPTAALGVPSKGKS